MSVRRSRLHSFVWPARFDALHTWVMPIDRHSSSQSNFSVPFEESWYSFGMAFSMAFGNCTCRYSNSLSEYLAYEDLVSEGGREGGAGTEVVARLTERSSGSTQETPPSALARCLSMGAA